MVSPDHGSAPGLAGKQAPASFREAAVVALSLVLLVWYRLRFALPAPLGRHSLLHRRMLAWGGRSGRSAPVLESAVARASERLSCLERSFLRALEQAPATRGSCVPRSLALVRLLRLHGFAAEIRVGMRRAGRGFAGHAWVVHHGSVIAQGSEFVGSFVPLLLAPAGGHTRVERVA